MLTTIDGRELTLSNLDKVLYPATGLTKAEVIQYYLQVAPVLLPYVADRALTRVRFPDGVDGRIPGTPGSTAFYEKNRPAGTPDWVRSVTVDTSDGLIDYVVAEEAATLVWLANLAALELHVPQWTISSGTPHESGVLALPHADSRPGEPLADRIVVDLDPGEGMTMVDSARAALIVAARLAGDGFLPVAQTSGSKGVQVYVAVRPCRSRDAWSYVKRLGAALHRELPETFVATMSIAQRAGHVYVDYNQNLAARNTIAPYSLRGRAQPAVATPVSFDELGSVRHPDDLRFAPDEVLHRVETLGDLAADLLIADAAPVPLD